MSFEKSMRPHAEHVVAYGPSAGRGPSCCFGSGGALARPHSLFLRGSRTSRPIHDVYASRAPSVTMIRHPAFVLFLVMCSRIKPQRISSPVRNLLPLALNLMCPLLHTRFHSLFNLSRSISEGLFDISNSPGSSVFSHSDNVNRRLFGPKGIFLNFDFDL